MKKHSGTKGKKGYVLVDRDFEIMEAIGQCGGLRASSVSTLFFRIKPEEWSPEPQSNAEKRLLILYDVGYLNRVEQASTRKQGSKPFIHVLTKKGVRALADHYGRDVSEIAWRKINGDSSTLFLDHLMWINEVRIACTYATQHVLQGASIETWTDDLQLKRDHSNYRMSWKWPSGNEETNTVIIPDGYFHIHTTAPEPHNYRHFLEIDLGTETTMSSKEERRTWERKIRMYTEFLKVGGWYEKEYKTRAVRVLTVTTSAKRLKRLKEVTEGAGGLSRFWFTTFDQLTPISVFKEPIWQQAGKEGQFTFFWD